MSAVDMAKAIEKEADALKKVREGLATIRGTQEQHFRNPAAWGALRDVESKLSLLSIDLAYAYELACNERATKVSYVDAMRRVQSSDPKDKHLGSLIAKKPRVPR